MSTQTTLPLRAAGQVATVATVADLPVDGVVEGSIRYVQFNNTTYTYDGSAWNALAGGSASVAWGDVTGTLANQTDLQAALDAKQDAIVGTNNSFAGFDGSGNLTDISDFLINTGSGGFYINLTEDVDSVSGGTVHQYLTNLDPVENAPNSAWNAVQIDTNIDTGSSGFDIGTNGSAARLLSLSYNHQGTSNTGSLDLISSNFNVGNGTDPIDVNGMSYAYGFGTVNANVTLSGPVQGYGFQPNVNASATLTADSYFIGFYDFCNIATASEGGHTSFAASPTIANIANNKNYTAFNIAPTITAFTGNAGVNGIAVSGNYGVMNANSSWNGVNINPTIDEARYAAGINVSMDNVTPYPGVESSLVFQDLTLEFNTAGDNNSYTLEYIPGGTAGSEIVTVNGTALEVQIDSGVSTATQVKAALDGNITIAGALSITISGTASNPQVTAGPTNFTGGVNPGQIQAANFDGDVAISGSLAFGGALSIGQLNAFASVPVVDGGGTPSSIHSLISSPTVANGVTVANADTLGVNTAALITIGNSATVTTAFLGIAALGLPAVVSLGSGSTVDRVAGAAFALSLSGTGSGGTIDEVALCRAIAIPDGLTTVNSLYGYKMDLPFGDPGTSTWGVYITPAVTNYFTGSVVVGTSDTPTNVSVGIELNATDRAVLLSRMSSAQESALTATNGMLVYNTTTHKFRGYANGTWIDLH